MTRATWPALMALLLSGCAHHLSTIDDGLSHQQRLQRLATIDDWSLVGRLVIDTGEQRDRVSVIWEQQGDRLNLTIRNIVIGAGSVRIEGNNEQLTITARGETRILDDPEEDLARELGLGWWLPVTSVHHWLLGRPDDRFPESSQVSAGGLLESLMQRDWQTVYEDFQLVDGLLLPRSLRMRHGTLELQLEITRFATTDSQA